MTDGALTIKLIETFGAFGLLFGAAWFSSRAVWRYLSQQFLPQRLRLIEKQTLAFERIADVVDRIDRRMSAIERRVDDISFDVSRLYVQKKQPQPSRANKMEEPTP